MNNNNSQRAVTYVNNSFAYDEKKTASFTKYWGKNYNSIDFAMYKDIPNKSDDNLIIGEMVVGDSKIPMTIKEAERIMETLTSVLSIRYRKAKLYR